MDIRQNIFSKNKIALWISGISSLLVIVYFYYILRGFGDKRAFSLLETLYNSWNEETRYEHGVMFPFIIIGIIAYQWKKIRLSAANADMRGLILIMIGGLLYILSHRVIQWRVGVGSLPFILTGLSYYLFGRKTAAILAFPFFYFWLSIPVPDIQQATGKLQIIATSISQMICSLFGVQTIAQGAQVFSTNNKWAPLMIDEGCSGIRSLMALMMISVAWGHLTDMPLWKKILFMLSAIPISIIGNGLRIASIFIIAEYGNAEFARKTWHDQSGLLLFYPISLLMLTMLHTLLEGRIPWKKKTVRRSVVSNVINENQIIP
jgi:exosortase